MMSSLSLILMISFFAFGCASKSLVFTDSNPQEMIYPETAQVQSSELEVKLPPFQVGGVWVQNRSFDIPIEVNENVEKWVHYFTGRGREHFALYLERGEHFIPYMKEILRREKLPEDLVYLAMIESGFSLVAKSRASAVGPWQFIRATGRRYGLRVDWWVDERKEVEGASLAAVRYLRDLYTLFGDWKLAWAGYNAGESKIQRVMRQAKTNDFWKISKYRAIKPETKNYVPKIMAAAIVAKNKTQFGFDERIPVERFIASEKNIQKKRQDYQFRPALAREGKNATTEVTSEFSLSGALDLLKLAELLSLDYKDIQRMNPHILRWFLPVDNPETTLHLPIEAALELEKNPDILSQVSEIDLKSVIARRYDTVLSIARRNGVHPEAVRALNGLNIRSRLNIGQEILLPIPKDGAYSLEDLDLMSSPLDSGSKKRKKYRWRRTRRV